MSIKLYHGLRLKDPSMSLFEVTRIVHDATTEVFNELRKELVAQEVLRIVDYPKCRENHQDQMVFFAAEASWRKDQQDMSSAYALHDPLRFSIVFGETPDNTVLAYPYFLKSEYMDALNATELFEDYGYWNNTDRPDEVTDKEWGKRLEDWESILHKNTFGHLPMWELYTEHTFGIDILMHDSIDVNTYLTPQQRITRVLIDTASTYIEDFTMSKFIKLTDITKDYVDKNLDNIKLPKKVTSLKTQVSDLPVYVPQQDVIDNILKAYNEEYHD